MDSRRKGIESGHSTNSAHHADPLLIQGVPIDATNTRNAMPMEWKNETRGFIAPILRQAADVRFKSAI
jgi:hypothetical protein